MAILTRKELEKTPKEKVVALLDDIAEAFDIDIEVVGNKDELIDRYLDVIEEHGDPADKIDSDSGDLDSGDLDAGDLDAGNLEAVDPNAEGGDDEGIQDLEGDPDVCVKAIKTFQTIVDGQKVFVARGQSEWLPASEAKAAIDAGLAELVDKHG